MKLLIITQAVDLDDPGLGFFHSWLEAFAARAERIEVICLKEGRHALPSNVRVHSLGKEKGAPRFFRKTRYALRFRRLIRTLAGAYDRVFVHMNQEYVLLGGRFWKMRGKTVVLWRNHKKGSLATRVAALLASIVCYTSPDAYVAKMRHAVPMPIGIDTERFVPPPVLPPAGTVLHLGRLDPVKRPEVFVSALQQLSAKGVDFRADVYGDSTVPGDPFASRVKRDAQDLVAVGKLAFHSAVPNRETPTLYGNHSLYVNLTPSGSFDKTIGEAMACGTVVVCANNAVKAALPEGFVVNEPSPAGYAKSMEQALALSDAERQELGKRLRVYIEENHSLTLLAQRLFELFV